MNKILINSEQEYFDLMKGRYWNNPQWTIDDWRRASYTSKPREYPFLLLHEWGTDYRGRTCENIEFVYLEDFNLQRCPNCDEIKHKDSIIWDEVFDEWRCNQCHSGV